MERDMDDEALVPLAQVVNTSDWSEDRIRAFYNQPRWTRVAEILDMPLDHTRGVVKMYLRIRQFFHEPNKLKFDTGFEKSTLSLVFEVPFTLPSGLTITQAIPAVQLAHKYYLASVLRNNRALIIKDDGEFLHMSPFLAAQFIHSISVTILVVLAADPQAAAGAPTEAVIDCVVCLDAIATKSIMPCKHKCLCTTCGQRQWQTCPLCRTNVASIQ